MAAVVLAASLIVRRVAARRLRAAAERTVARVDYLMAELIAATRFPFLLVFSLYIGSLAVLLPARVSRIADKAVVLALLFQAAAWGNRAIVFWLSGYVGKSDVDASAKTTVTLLSYIGKAVVWAVILLLMLENVGVNVTSLIAGLGIGGVAVALASQNVLGDLFASLVIALDKPFVVGDSIAIDDLSGSVEDIGLKTTRVRSVSGEQIIFSNTDLLKGRLRNYKSMGERRVVFSLGVTCQTPAGKLEAIPGAVREIIEGVGRTRFDRAHFQSFGDSSLNFEVVYHVEGADYNLYMDVQQEINLAIYRRFEAEGIEMAYPTRTLYINKT